MLSARVSALTPVREPTLEGDEESGCGAYGFGGGGKVVLPVGWSGFSYPPNSFDTVSSASGDAGAFLSRSGRLRAALLISVKERAISDWSLIGNALLTVDGSIDLYGSSISH